MSDLGREFWERHCHLSGGDLAKLHPDNWSDPANARKAIRRGKRQYKDLPWRTDPRAIDAADPDTPPSAKPKKLTIPNPRDVEVEHTVIISDLHVPFHDPDAVAVAFSFIRELQPARVILNGDIQDFYQLSRFDKSPDRLTGLQAEFDQTNAVLDALDGCLPIWCEKVYVVGNHEDRLRRWMWSNPEVASLRDFSLERQLRLDTRGYELITPKGRSATCRVGTVEVGHFNRVLKHSAYTARALVEDRGCSIVQGHTHRLGVHYKRKGGSGEQLVGFEGGCLCDLSPEYVNEPDWQHGLVVMTKQVGSNRFHLQQHEIIGGELLVGSQRY